MASKKDGDKKEKKAGKSFLGLKKTTIYFLIALAVFAVVGVIVILISGIFIKAEPSAPSVGGSKCTLSLDAKVVGNSIQFSWKLSGYTLKSGDYFILGDKTTAPGLYPAGTATSYTVTPKPTTLTKYEVSLQSGSTSLCRSAELTFQPPSTISGGGSGGTPPSTNDPACSVLNLSAPTLAVKGTKNGNQVTIELGWANTAGGSAITSNRGLVYKDGTQAANGDLRTNQYFYYSESFPATETHSYFVRQSIPLPSSGGTKWCETANSNTVKWDGSTGQVVGGQDPTTTDQIFTQVTPPGTTVPSGSATSGPVCISDTNECQGPTAGWLKSHWNIMAFVSFPVWVAGKIAFFATDVAADLFAGKDPITAALDRINCEVNKVYGEMFCISVNFLYKSLGLQ